MSKIFCVIVMSFFLPGLSAQEVKPICDTLVLANGRELIILVESVSATHLFYKRCLDTNDVVLSIPLNYVKGLKVDAEIHPGQGRVGTVNTLPENSLSYPIFQTWTFWNKKKNMKKQISIGDPIKVHYIQGHQQVVGSGINRNVIANGILHSIDPDFLVIQENVKPILKIPRSAVTRITYTRNSNTSRIFGSIAIMIGFIVLGVVVAIALIVGLFFALLFGGSGSGLFDDEASVGFLVGALLVIAGLIAVLSPLSKGIKKPFSNDWEVYPEAFIGEPSSETMMP